MNEGRTYQRVTLGASTALVHSNLLIDINVFFGDLA